MDCPLNDNTRAEIRSFVEYWMMRWRLWVYGWPDLEDIEEDNQ